MTGNRLNKRTGFFALLLMVFLIKAHAQIIPNTQTFPGATSQTLNPIPSAYSGTITLNYIRTWEAEKPFPADTVLSSKNRLVQEVKQSTQYFDGLGRPLQTVVKGISPAGYDMVSSSIYDSLGREQYKYLPYVSPTSDGNFKNSPFAEQNSFLSSFYNPTANSSGEKFFYGQSVFESSPINRLTASYAPGNSWAGTALGSTMQYAVSTSADSVVVWNIPYTNGVTPTSAGYYSYGQLFKNITTDERGNKVVEYKDKANRVVLKKVQIVPSPATGPSGWLCTYYIYDDLNNLRFVIQPQGVVALKSLNWVFDATTYNTSAIAKGLCFSYEYDLRNRMIIKRVPGAGEVWMIYDQRDRLVFTQDSILRSQNQWLSTLYDGLNRPVMTGMLNYASTQSAFQTAVTSQTASGTVTSYGDTPPTDLTLTTTPTAGDYQASNSITMNPGFASNAGGEFSAIITNGGGSGGASTESLPVTASPLPSGAPFTPLTVTYYDNYNWVSTSGSGLTSSLITTYTSNTSYFYTADDNNFPYPRGIVSTNLTNGMVTGTKVNVVGGGSYLFSVNYYDDRARMIQTQSSNYTGGKDTVTMQYGFTGKVLRTLVGHGKGGANVLSYLVLTKSFYDAAGRVIAVNKKIGNSLEDSIAVNSYDELGQLSLKKLGRARTSLTNFAYTTNPIDTLRYTYNIRGWLRGINKDYANSANGASNWFGMELNYDFGFTQSQFNGNIAGMKWRNNGDGAQRAYGFNYDAANRLLSADFTQYTSGAWGIGAGINFSVSNLAYDYNGNIMSMTQKGLKLNSSQVIDSLLYGYNGNSNQLNYVTDKNNDTTAHLGDFTEINNNTSQDYTYDGNGNLTVDNNKGISAIAYNYLNLPQSIAITNKGVISYVYDAGGNKLQKITIDNPANKKTVTTYVGGFVYQYTSVPSGGTGLDTLQFVAQEEGRARPKNVAKTDTVFYDFYEKDHLGNTRVLLTDELAQDIYPAATLENNTSAFNTESNYYNINTADTISVNRIASWSSTTGNNYPNNNGNPPYNNNPYANTTATSNFVYRLNGNTGDKTGLGITLKVMTGDIVNIYAKSFWHNNTGSNPSNTYLINSALNSFIAAFAGTPVVSGVHGATATALEGSAPTSSGVSSWVTSVPNPASATVPKAYINWILFNDQFVPIASNCGFDLVSTSADAVKSHSSTVSITSSGYLYVYCSNESNVDVFFDNLQLIQTRGPLLETTNYYPFGLTMAGISDKAVKSNYAQNKYRYNGKELQNQEFSDGSGLEQYNFGARFYDQQIGRFVIQDRFSEKYNSFSPYSFVSNDPIHYTDINGDSINFKQLISNTDGSLNAEGLYALMNILGDLQQITGLNLSVSGEGMLTSQGETKGAKGFSEDARGYVKGIIGDEKENINVELANKDKSSEVIEKNTVSINTRQIDGNIGALEKEGLGKLTDGYGFSFLHETLHTYSGTHVYYPGARNVFHDPPGYNPERHVVGDVEETINKYRQQMRLAERLDYFLWPGTNGYSQDWKSIDGKTITTIRQTVVEDKKNENKQ